MSCCCHSKTDKSPLWTLSRDISIGVFEQAVKKNRSSMATRKKRGTQKTRQYSKDAKQAKEAKFCTFKEGAQLLLP